MARKSKKATENVAVIMDNDIIETSLISALSENNSSEVIELTDNSVKCVSLNQLYIIREYIDNKIEALLNALVESDSGVHGLRYKDGKLQHQNSDGTWSDIVTNNSDGSTGNTPGGGLTNSDFATDEEVRDIFKNV